MGGNQGHNLNFGYFQQILTDSTAQMTLVTTTGFVGISTYPPYPLQVNWGYMAGFTYVYVRTGY